MIIIVRLVILVAAVAGVDQSRSVDERDSVSHSEP